MGSLMAGWNSSVLNNKKAQFARSTSFTREEIETYKKTQRDSQEEHSRAAAELAMQMKAQQIPDDGPEIKEEDVPANPSGLSVSVEEELEKIGRFKDWWTKSNWAFLNDSAMDRLNVKDYKYTAQYEVASKAVDSTEN